MVVHTFEEVLLFFDKMRREGLSIEPQGYSIGDVYSYKGTPIAVEVNIRLTRIFMTLTFNIDIMSMARAGLEERLYPYGSHAAFFTDQLAAELSHYACTENKEGLFYIVDYLFTLMISMKYYLETARDVRLLQRLFSQSFYQAHDDNIKEFGAQLEYLLDKEEDEDEETTSINPQVKQLAQRL